jgi:hypothetical protein
MSSAFQQNFQVSAPQEYGAPYFFDKFRVLLKPSWFNTPQLAAENWGCGEFVPPHTQIFQGEILNTPELAPGILYSQWGLIPMCN